MASIPWPTDSDSSYGYQQHYGHSHHYPSYEYGQQYGGYGGHSHGYGQQQYGTFMIPPQVQQPPPDAYPFPTSQFEGQVHLIPDPSNYGQGPPRRGNASLILI